MIYGLLGFKGSGKSTVAKYLEKEHGFYRLNFKDALIAELKQNFPDLLTYYQHLYGVTEIDELFETKPDPIRFLMQNYGTEVRRKENEDYWVDKWVAKVTQLHYDGITNIVVDDARFMNEIRAVKNWNGMTIRIISDVVTTGGTHSSETSLLDYKSDYVINSVQGDFDKLYSDICKIVDKSKSQD